MSLEYYFVFDTNVLVSALLSKNGKARQAFNKARRLGKLLMSESTLLELVTVFARPKLNKYVSSLEKEIFIVMIAKATKVIEIQSEIVVCRDEKDNQYLELAIDGQATCIVSGDSDLLVVNPFREIPILTIQEFLDHDFSR
ncbi:MAG: putative toxin-antitoxin system toxin component, PIN family [Microcystis aeruginosa W13-18]|jgi:putative PIN family toxin of toxin-antitoxin system|nr:putative toxin-antitoxin system toxin component, PIN family [Microcystis aeruginosa W13-18]NCR37734.1 putative toxin-antitoxin system toxin component, PIN family [Microcystis aeruginosa S11-05]NCR51239.1 putative toxin-antitoxin system toxin component, PIN family [Microcystis aeruginosa S11-01]NCS50416.1 putative toxin-antitoxin system toxin component, PIN family [Microcystis aeruginosa BK11-02]NCS78810.1 putative toxin-antitoxin system toxin component, PIN family [Microcystis aeruginosa K13